MNARALALSVAIVLGSVAATEAQQPTLADIALCNEEAATQTQGSAFPRPRAPETIAPRAGAGSEGQPRERADPSGAVIAESPDPLVRGMDAGKANDPEYRAAYRDCMRQRLGKAR